MTRNQLANLLYDVFFAAALLWMASCIAFRMGDSRAECLFNAILGGGPLFAFGWALRYALTQDDNSNGPTAGTG